MERQINRYIDVIQTLVARHSNVCYTERGDSHNNVAFKLSGEKSIWLVRH